MLGHILKGESLLKEVIEGRTEVKRGRGKLRIMMLDDIKADETYEKIKHKMENVGENGCLESAFKRRDRLSQNKKPFQSIYLNKNLIIY